ELLKTTAKRIMHALRKNDLVARLGGDEFAILLDETNYNKINDIATRLLSNIEKKVDIEANEIYVTASVGISLYPKHGQLADSLVNAADTAMYHAKKNGKNRFTISFTNSPPPASLLSATSRLD
ncbi:MAG: GGDEF domain-containing protein, partial [Thiohalomonadales bacterium]